MSEKFTPEEQAKFTESRTLEDAKLIEHGAHYKPNESGHPRLEVTRRQVETIRNSHPSTKVEKPRVEKTEVAATFEIPDQQGELDFKRFLDKPLFNQFYRSVLPEFLEDEEKKFQQLVYETAEPFSGIKGRTFQEIAVKGKIGEKAVLMERTIPLMSLNEWRYLFTKLTKEQLLGNTYYQVLFPDGVVRTIEVSLSLDGAGPYGYSLSIKKMPPQGSMRISYVQEIPPRFIAPQE